MCDRSPTLRERKDMTEEGPNSLATVSITDRLNKNQPTIRQSSSFLLWVARGTNEVRLLRLCASAHFRAPPIKESLVAG